jgi:hypothetical protein
MSLIWTMYHRQWWAAILKNVSFKAIQINNFWEKNQIKRYNFVLQNFCHRWSDQKHQTKIFLHRWSDKIGQILYYKSTFLSIQTYFPSDEAIQSVQKPIFWSDAAIQYPKVQFTDEETQSPSILENVSITAILQGGSDISGTISKLYCFMKKIYF